MTRRAPLADWEREHIAAAYRNGEKVEAIAVEFAVGRATVCKVAKDAGLAIRRAGYRRVLKGQGEALR